MKRTSSNLAKLVLGVPGAGRAIGHVLAGAALAVSVSCSSPLGSPPASSQPPETAAAMSTASPRFLRHDPTGPGLSTRDTSFVAVAGQRMAFRVFPDGTQSGSDRFLDLDLDDKSLAEYPPGHPRAGDRFSPGDTITISVHIDPVILSVELGPEGLRFDADHPARLELSYRFADPDLDGDGQADPALESAIGMYRQAIEGSPWIRLDAELDLLADRVKYDSLTSFSRYALAF